MRILATLLLILIGHICLAQTQMQTPITIGINLNNNSALTTIREVESRQTELFLSVDTDGNVFTHETLPEPIIVEGVIVGDTSGNKRPVDENDMSFLFNNQYTGLSFTRRIDPNTSSINGFGSYLLQNIVVYPGPDLLDKDQQCEPTEYYKIVINDVRWADPDTTRTLIQPGEITGKVLNDIHDTSCIEVSHTTAVYEQYWGTHPPIHLTHKVCDLSKDVFDRNSGFIGFTSFMSHRFGIPTSIQIPFRIIGPNYFREGRISTVISVKTQPDKKAVNPVCRTGKPIHLASHLRLYDLPVLKGSQTYEIELMRSYPIDYTRAIAPSFDMKHRNTSQKISGGSRGNIVVTLTSGDQTVSTSNFVSPPPTAPHQILMNTAQFQVAHTLFQIELVFS